MKRILPLIGIGLAATALAACNEGYGYDAGYTVGTPYAYDGYYDNYYGPIYDGYWGNDNYFYYRSSDHDRDFHRGDREHFNRSQAMGGNWHAMHGNFTPNQGMRAPHWDRGHHNR